MKWTKWWGLLMTLVGFLLGAWVVRADGLTLTNIGALSTAGVDYSTVNYTGGIPTLVGTATPGAQVAVKIKATTGYVTTGSPSGVWQFIPASLDVGSNPIVITAGDQSLAFVLNFNATPSASPTATLIPEELPSAGTWGYYLPIVGIGILVLLLGSYIKDRMYKWEGGVK